MNYTDLYVSAWMNRAKITLNKASNKRKHSRILYAV